MKKEPSALEFVSQPSFQSAVKAMFTTERFSMSGFCHDTVFKKRARFAGMIASMLFAGSAHAAIMGFSGQFSNDTPTPGPDPSCAADQVLVSFNPMNSTAAGTSNFGNFGPSQSHCIKPGFPYSGGTFNFAFAAGDELWGSTAGYFTATATPGVVNSFVTYTALGGSGRFLGASGTLDAVGVLDRRPARPLNALSLSGTLNLPAVPEPASWALLITGFGMTGAAMRRRRAAMAAA